ncbi:hypothetical protein AVEN_73866-1 [Araneus ventricosus]|uniref:Uncharacterized protein n=1 Tax=Araneus ventricosus TaxID=182803 RepID=A0A4Y2G188_ARAVE|nr:hypothetical protein AVEN_73866-1 [Araneus ventricosus]
MVRATALYFYERGFDPRLGGVRSFVTILHRNRPRGDFFLLAPLKPEVLGRKRYELDSTNMGGHSPPPSITFPLRRTEWVEVCKDNWTPYRVYLLSDLRTSPPLKRSQPPQTYVTS